MRAADIAERVNHREHNQTERQRDADVCDRAAANFIDNDRARASEDECESPDEFRREASKTFLWRARFCFHYSIFYEQHLVSGGVSVKLNFSGLNSEGVAAGGIHFSIAKHAVCRNVRRKITS